MFDWLLILLNIVSWVVVWSVVYDHFRLKKAFRQFASTLNENLEQELATSRLWREQQALEIRRMSERLMALSRSRSSGVTREAVEIMIKREIDKLGKFY